MTLGILNLASKSMVISSTSRALAINELLSAIIMDLPLPDLASFSLVSKGWQIVAFPRLYHTVYLTFAQDLKHITRQILSNKVYVLSIQDYLRKLIISGLEKPTRRHSPGDFIEEEDLDDLLVALPNLALLEHFSWQMSFAPRSSKLLEILQTNCPRLNSIHWVDKSFGGINFYDGELLVLD